MPNAKIPKGYQGHYMKNSSGGETLVMVSKTVDFDEPKKPKQKGEKAVPKNTAKPTQTTMQVERPRGRDFHPSDRMKYHSENADKAYKEKNFVKATNHLQGYRQAQKELKDRADFMKENPDYVRKADR